MRTGKKVSQTDGKFAKLMVPTTGYDWSLRRLPLLFPRTHWRLPLLLLTQFFEGKFDAFPDVFVA